MTTNKPFLFRFVTRLYDDSEDRDTGSHPQAAGERHPLNVQAETRFTRVRNETTDDD